jgi:endonuclease YncB( thermonuclease family)
MLRDGWAVSYRHHEPGFIAAESDARAASRGIWQGTFELPQEWRARHRDMQSVSGEMILED